jgi:hypothetical protein
MKRANVHGMMRARKFLPKGDGELGTGYPSTRIPEKGDGIS